MKPERDLKDLREILKTFFKAGFFFIEQLKAKPSVAIVSVFGGDKDASNE